MFWPLLAYGAATLVSAVFSVDRRVSLVDSKQLVLFAIVPIAYRLLRGPADAESGRRHHHGRRVQRGLRHRPVPDLRLRQPRPARAGHARALHDLLRAAHAGRLRRRRRASCFAQQDRLWAALIMPARAGRARADLHPQRLGRRLRRHRPAVPAPRLPARGCSCRSRRAVPRLRAGANLPIASTRPSASTIRRTSTGWR